MSGDGATRSLAIAAAGIAAVIGVAGLQITRSSTPTTKRRTERRADDVDVALLRLHVPRDWRDVVKNDVYLDKTVARAVERLVIYVVGGSRPAVINYVSELYNLTWDVACIKNRPHLDIRILGATMDKGVPKWEDLVALPELNAVFMDDDAVTPDQLNALRDGLAPISFQPLGGFTAPYFRDDLHYFENRETSLQGHSVVLLGGTFDHLHNGHKKLLSLAVGISQKKLIIGITSEEMLRKKKHADLIESLEVREHKVRAYVTFLKPSLEVEFAVLTDAFGPAIDVANPDAALVVSTETIAAVPMIQDIRSSRGLTPLQIFVCRRTDASTLSSSYIRDRLAERNAQRR